MSEHVAMFINLANDPMGGASHHAQDCPDMAEYLAFEKGMHHTGNFDHYMLCCRGTREVSSSKVRFSRKGFPGYLYSDLASL